MCNVLNGLSRALKFTGGLPSASDPLSASGILHVADFARFESLIYSCCICSWKRLATFALKDPSTDISDTGSFQPYDAPIARMA